MRISLLFVLAIGIAVQQPASCQQQAPEAGNIVDGYTDTPQLPGQPWKVHDSSRPRPQKVTPGPLSPAPPPADAIKLFDGKDLSQWVTVSRGGTTEAKWKVQDGYFEIAPGTGKLQTKAKFGDCQLHVEWMAVKVSEGRGQDRGNSGVEIMGRYEIQILESYENRTYADGQAASIYGQWPPMVNASRPEAEWNVYDIFFEAPRFEGDKLAKPAYVTVIHNGILVHHHQEITGAAVHRRVASYSPHAAMEALSLQDHRRPVRYRNIWIRPIGGYDK